MLAWPAHWGWGGGGGSRQGKKTGRFFVGNSDGGELLVGFPVGCGGVDGQAVGLAVGVCLGVLCAAPSVVAGRVGRIQL